MTERQTYIFNFSTYKPSELIAIFSAALGKQSEFDKLVSLHGIFQQRQKILKEKERRYFSIFAA